MSEQNPHAENNPRQYKVFQPDELEKLFDEVNRKDVSHYEISHTDNGKDLPEITITICCDKKLPMLNQPTKSEDGDQRSDPVFSTQTNEKIYYPQLLKQALEKHSQRALDSQRIDFSFQETSSESRDITYSWKNTEDGTKYSYSFTLPVETMPKNEERETGLREIKGFLFQMVRALSGKEIPTVKPKASGEGVNFAQVTIPAQPARTQ